MKKIDYKHIESLIDETTYIINPDQIICNLQVGESVVCGVSHCFDRVNIDIERGKESARNRAIDALFSLEGYHQKRLRDEPNIRHGIKKLPIYSTIMREGGVLRLTDVFNVEEAEDDNTVFYRFDLIPYPQTLMTLGVYVNPNQDVAQQLQDKLEAAWKDAQTA